MLKKIDNFLNQITMYRLILYYLTALWLVALVASYFGVLSFGPLALLFSTVILIVVSWLVNWLCAAFLKVQLNVESVYITAFILALIITPPQANHYSAIIPFLFWVAVWAAASKYIFNFNNKHIFNPTAVAVVITSITMNQSASWWIGTAWLLPFVLVGGLLVIRKVRKFDAVIGFWLAALTAMAALTAGNGLNTVWHGIVDSPLIFLAAVMLTEPLTMPPTRDGRIAYGVLVGWLFAPQVHFGSWYPTPEIALLIGNVFSFLISPKGRYVLFLKEKKEVGVGTYDFIFKQVKPLVFKPGQYLEWTLGHRQPDARGNRRYFTIASSPTEPDLRLGVKFYQNPSSFKQKLLSLNVGDQIVAGNLAGDFVLPDNCQKKLVFLAGGIGITPFRSMLKYLVDRGEKRDIIFMYSNRTQSEIVYGDVLAEAKENLKVKMVGALTDEAQVPADWPGHRGYIDAKLIASEVPDYLERYFYISGSHVMVSAFKETLIGLGVRRSRIKTDFFPGLA